MYYTDKKEELKIINSKKRKIDLDGKTWLQNSISIWSNIKKSKIENEIKHPAMFPSMLAERLISIYSFEGDIIFDPFAGTGSTLIAAKKLNRKSIGIELSEEFINLYNIRTKNYNLFKNYNYEPKMIHGDSNNLNEYIEAGSISLTITSPPYWDILNQKRTADYKNIRNYGESNVDLGNIKSYTIFLYALKSIFKKVYDVTKKSGYCCIVLMDLRKKDKFYPFHMDTTIFMREIGFELDDIIIWDRRHEYNNLRPLGFPFVFRINKIHEFILIFKKP